MVNAVDNLKVLREAVRLAIGGNRLDALAARLVVLHVGLAVVLEALLLKGELNIDGVGHLRLRLVSLSFLTKTDTTSACFIKDCGTRGTYKIFKLTIVACSV